MTPVASPVSGIGDEAYESEAFGLVVLKGDVCFTLAANAAVATAEAEEGAERAIQEGLGAQAVERVP